MSRHMKFGELLERFNGQIDWDRVSKGLRCPTCGDKADIDPGTDGNGASHTHRFKVTREQAIKLSMPTDEEIMQALDQAKVFLARVKGIIGDENLRREISEVLPYYGGCSNCGSPTHQFNECKEDFQSHV
jgi:hypothetical protein